MIAKVKITKFKKWRNKTLELHPQGVSLLIGGNNSGKSSILQALSLWSFCKIVVENEKGPDFLYSHPDAKGVGINLDDFSPINIPDLSYLWTGTSTDGKYSLSIEAFWNREDGTELHLGFILSLVQERLFIKTFNSNLNDSDRIPNVTMLTPFAGIEVREEMHSQAIRTKFIGKGLSGSVLRNEIIDLYEKNLKLRAEKKGTLPKIKASDLKTIRENDPYELLQKALFDVFRLQLYPERFNPAFHTYLRVNIKKGEIEKNRFKPFNKFKARDIMSEGSGFLQWLSVLTYALSPNVDVLLLDEPDAHLHPMLQENLFTILDDISRKNNKQIIIATHSSEIIKKWDLKSIIWINDKSIGYLSDEDSRVAALNNIGSEFCPKLDKIKRGKRILFCENETDGDILQIWCRTLGKTWPEVLTVWENSQHHKERKHIHDHLVKEIRELKSISLNDRDFANPEIVTSGLKIKGEDDIPADNPTFFKRCWQRHEIESYMLHPQAIARAVAKKRRVSYAPEILDEVKEYLNTEHGLVFNRGFTQAERTPALAPLFDADGHACLDGLKKRFKISAFDIVKQMRKTEIFEDVKTLIDQIITICQ